MSARMWWLAATLVGGRGAGGAIVVEKMAVPGVGWLIYCTDPGGVLFGCMESDESAA